MTVDEKTPGSPLRQDSVEFRRTSKIPDKNKSPLLALESRKSMPPEEFLSSLLSAQEAWKTEPDHFPFSSLTRELQIRIFTYLNPAERGSIAVVCKKWNSLIRSPDLWSVVDLVAFPPSQASNLTDVEDEDYDESMVSYIKYQRRTRKFMNFLISVRPKVKRFKFAFDIADIKDGWMEGIEMLMRSCQLQEIKSAELIWNETPAKPSILDSVSITWCTSDYKDLMYKHRHRQRYFVKFFDLFTSLCSSIVQLVVPFDWTERSIRSLARLYNLETLTLARYFIFQNLEQRQVDLLLSSLPNVTHLSFEVWTPSGRGLQTVRFHSESLLSLDASQCRGIRLDRDLQLPNLQRLCMSLNPMKGPLGSGPGAGPGESAKVAGFDTDEEDAELGVSFSSVCLYDALRYGAPNLQYLNDLELNPCWKEGSYQELEEVLMSVCLCPRHLMASHMARERVGMEEEEEEEDDKED